MDKPIKQLMLLKDTEVTASDGDLTFKFKKGSMIPVVEETEDKVYVYAIASDKNGNFSEQFIKDYMEIYGKFPRVYFEKSMKTLVKIMDFRENWKEYNYEN